MSILIAFFLEKIAYFKNKIKAKHFERKRKLKLDKQFESLNNKKPSPKSKLKTGEDSGFKTWLESLYRTISLYFNVHALLVELKAC